MDLTSEVVSMWPTISQFRQDMPSMRVWHSLIAACELKLIKESKNTKCPTNKLKEGIQFG